MSLCKVEDTYPFILVQSILLTPLHLINFERGRGINAILGIGTRLAAGTQFNSPTIMSLMLLFSASNVK